MYVHGGGFSTTGPYVTVAELLQYLRENQGSSGAAAGGQNAWGHAQKAAPELEPLVFGLHRELEWERSCEGTSKGPEESFFYSVK